MTRIAWGVGTVCKTGMRRIECAGSFDDDVGVDDRTGRRSRSRRRGDRVGWGETNGQMSAAGTRT